MGRDEKPARSEIVASWLTLAPSAESNLSVDVGYRQTDMIDQSLLSYISNRLIPVKG